VNAAGRAGRSPVFPAQRRPSQDSALGRGAAQAGRHHRAAQGAVRHAPGPGGRDDVV